MPLFWNVNGGTENRQRDADSDAGAGANGREVLAVTRRRECWQVEVVEQCQGTAPELYDLSTDIGETTVPRSRTWGSSIRCHDKHFQFDIQRHRKASDAATPIVRLKAQDIASLAPVRRCRWQLDRPSDQRHVQWQLVASNGR